MKTADEIEFAINMLQTPELKKFLVSEGLTTEQKKEVAEEISARENATVDSILKSWSNL